MLIEIAGVRQVPGEQPRRWFFSHEQDLLVWFSDDGRPAAFQLAYDKLRAEHAIRWRAGRGFVHHGVDDGEALRPGKKGAPLLVPDGPFRAAAVLEQFLKLSAALPQEIAAFVADRLREHPAYAEEG